MVFRGKCKGNVEIQMAVLWVWNIDSVIVFTRLGFVVA